MKILKSLFIVVWFISSCAKPEVIDPCDAVTCLNGGTCDDGTCLCPTGFTGADCGTAVVIDLCQNVDCGANGTCVDGICDCLPGYEGSDCNTESRTKFLGVYTTADDCTQSGSNSYMAGITNSGIVTEVLISNFWDLFQNDVTAVIDSTSIIINRQEPDGGGFFVEGEGNYDLVNNQINFSYTISDETDPANIQQDICTSIWTK